MSYVLIPLKVGGSTKIAAISGNFKVSKTAAFVDSPS